MISTSDLFLDYYTGYEDEGDSVDWCPLPEKKKKKCSAFRMEFPSSSFLKH